MIIPMKKAKLIALKEDKEALLLSLQRCGEFMAIPPDEETEQTAKNEQIDLDVQQADAMLRFMQRYQKKKSFFSDRPVYGYDEFIKRNEKGEALVQETSAISDKLSAAHSEIMTLKSECSQLAPWLSMDVPIEELRPTQYTNFHIGYLPPLVHEEIVAAVAEHNAEIQLFGKTAEGQAALIVSFMEDDAALSDNIKVLGFVEASLPRVTGTASEISKSNQEKIELLEKDIESYEKQMAELAGSQQELELLSEQYKAEQERQSVKFMETVETVCVEGWVRNDRMESVENAVSQVTDVYDLEYSDPEEGEQPPTALKNKKFWKPFESITDMYSPPKPGTIDPTPVSAPWFWVIFGMMMGDFGYGALMAIIFGLMKKIMKPKGQFGMLVTLLFYSSITTMIFGILFGSYFGETFHPILFSPLDNPVAMLIFSLVIGVLHIFSGMAIKIVEQVRAGHVLDAIFDQVSWMLLIAGAGLIFLEQTRTVGMVLAIVGAVIILFTAGREKKNIVGKAFGGIMGLYDVTSYLSDILSYARILALGLATGVIAMVMNILAGMVQINVLGFILSLVIYFIGHVFNITMSLLSAYVHDSRLQYIEFFNKFYDGGGYNFEPLAIQTKSIDVIDNSKEV